MMGRPEHERSATRARATDAAGTGLIAMRMDSLLCFNMRRATASTASIGIGKPDRGEWPTSVGR
jgi:hypothetical protein